MVIGIPQLHFQVEVLVVAVVVVSYPSKSLVRMLQLLGSFLGGMDLVLSPGGGGLLLLPGPIHGNNNNSHYHLP
jgi:hypothetical protein